MKRLGKRQFFEYDINELVQDILLVGEWLKPKENTVKCSTHTDQQFYDEVFIKLSEDVRVNSEFYGHYMK